MENSSYFLGAATGGAVGRGFGSSLVGSGFLAPGSFGKPAATDGAVGFLKPSSESLSFPNATVFLFVCAFGLLTIGRAGFDFGAISASSSSSESPKSVGFFGGGPFLAAARGFAGGAIGFFLKSSSESSSSDPNASVAFFF
jgi:hypothetical protein